MLRKINLICVGGLKKNYLRVLENKFLGNINLIVIEESNLEVESKSIIKILDRYIDKYSILFDLKGGYSNCIYNEILHQFYKGYELFFIVGGSNGVSDNLRKRCNLSFKLSDFTYSHQIFRITAIMAIRKILFNL